jgi:DNA-binding beta-propeller fold protein YncE
MKISSQSAVRAAWLLAGALCLAGCATKKPAAKEYMVFPPPPDEPRIQYLTSFGSEDDLHKASKFNAFIVGQEKVLRPITKPYGVAIKGGKIYVCDTQAGCVAVADLVKGRIHYLRPQGTSAMKMPVNVAVDKDDTVYVTDTLRGQIMVLGQDGGLIEAVGLKDEMKPCGLAIAGDKLYVTDLKNSCVRVYDKATRKVLSTFATKDGDPQGRVFQPTNLAVDSKGNVYVSDTGGFVVKVYDASGHYVRTVGEHGVTPGQFSLPKGLAVDRDNRLYVLDAAAPVVQLFDAEGRLLMFFGQPNTSGDAGLYLPAAMTVDYENAGLFQKYVQPGYKAEYVILLTNQVGPHKVSVFAFLKKA